MFVERAAAADAARINGLSNSHIVWVDTLQHSVAVQHAGVDSTDAVILPVVVVAPFLAPAARALDDVPLVTEFAVELGAGIIQVMRGVEPDQLPDGGELLSEFG